MGIAVKLISHSLHQDRTEIQDLEAESSFDITTPERSKINSHNEQLTNALKSKYEFDDAYEALSQKCFRCFEICNRESSVMYLKADLALLYFTRQNYQKAAEFFSQICFRYSELGWNHIDAMLIERYAICQRQLKDNKDLIQCYLHLVRFPDYLELETYNFYFDQLKLCCMNAPSIHETINCSLFSLGSISIMDNLGPGESVGVSLQLHNTMAKVLRYKGPIFANFSSASYVTRNSNLNQCLLFSKAGKEWK
jgi:tetratricopeptide (TPR) repeat protein